MVSYLLGNYMVEKGLMTKEQLQYVICIQEKIRVKLGLIAVSEGLLTLEQADEINRRQQVMDKRFGDIAVGEGYLTELQVQNLLKMQGNEYLTFAQTLVDEGIVAMGDVQTILKDYQSENGFTNTEMELIKSGDAEKIAPLFLPKGAEEYQEAVIIALKTFIRCIDRQAYPMYGKLVNKAELETPVMQELSGTEYWKIGLSDINDGLCVIASIFARENYNEVNEDVQDAAGEFVNCISGLFATARSVNNITLELQPPEPGKSGLIYGNDILVMPFGFSNVTVNFVVTNKKGWR